MKPLKTGAEHSGICLLLYTTCVLQMHDWKRLWYSVVIWYESRVLLCVVWYQSHLTRPNIHFMREILVLDRGQLRNGHFSLLGCLVECRSLYVQYAIYGHSTCLKSLDVKLTFKNVLFLNPCYICHITYLLNVKMVLV